MANVLYQNRDQSFTVTVYDTDGVTVVPASTYLNAQYRVYPVGSCTPVASKSLGSGISVVGNNFVVTLTELDLTVSGTNGEYKHTFIVGTTADELLPAIFDSVVDIIPGCAI